MAKSKMGLIFDLEMEFGDWGGKYKQNKWLNEKCHLKTCRNFMWTHLKPGDIRLFLLRSFLFNGTYTEIFVKRYLLIVYLIGT